MNTKLLAIYTISQVEKENMFDTGVFNDILRGYVLMALDICHLTTKERENIMDSIHESLDFYTAKQAHERAEKEYF